MKKLLISIFFILFYYSSLQAQVAINTDGSAANISAMLDIKSTAKGVLLPRLTTFQRKAIINPSQGLLVFDLDKNSLYLFDGVLWQAMMFVPNSLIPPVPRTAVDEPFSRGFGRAVSISGDYAIVGAPTDTSGTNINQGAAYIFFRAGGSWVQQAKLVASDGTTGDILGVSVAIAGDYAIVGAPNKAMGTNYKGAAYIFVRTGTVWTQQAKLVASDGASTDYFGRAVSISGNRVLIGAPQDDIGPNSNQGSAYIFFRSGATWTQQTKIAASDGASDDKFGNAVSLFGNDLLVGAEEADVPGKLNAGAAYVFYYNSTLGWIAGNKLLATDGGVSNDNFGHAVAIEGDYAAVTGLGNPFAGRIGRLFIYFRSGGIFSWQTYMYDPESGVSEFGESLSMSGDYIIVGAPNAHWSITRDNDGTGTSYLYKRSSANWDLVREINDPSSDPTRRTGGAVSISGFNVIISDQTKEKVYFANFEE